MNTENINNSAANNMVALSICRRKLNAVTDISKYLWNER